MGSFIQLKWTESNTEVVNLITKLNTKKATTLSLNSTFTPLSSVKADITDTSSKGVTYVAKLPLTEDISYDFRSNFQSASGMAGSVGDLVGRLKSWQSALGGTTQSFYQIFDYQIWENTEPLKINLEVTFTLQDNALYDVALPVWSLCGLTAISSLGNSANPTGYSVPGLNLRNMNNVDDSSLGGDDSTSPTASASTEARADNALKADLGSKFLSFHSAEFVDPMMLVTEAKPTFSQIHTQSGLPAFAKVQLQLQTVKPASDTSIFRALLREASKASNTSITTAVTSVLSNL